MEEKTIHTEIQDELGFIHEHVQNILDKFHKIEMSRKLTSAEEIAKSDCIEIRSKVRDGLLSIDTENFGDPWK